MTVRTLDDQTLGETVEEESRTVTVRAEWRATAGATPGDRDLSRPVLVKRLKPGLPGSPEVAHAFVREAELLQRLDHPSLPTLIDCVVDGDGYALVVPDHGGERLETLLRRLERLDPTTAMAIGIEVSRGLTVLHRHGIVHGRLLARYVELNPSGSVRLFGLPSGRPGDGPAGDEALEDDLSLPEDMAPEQIIGEPPDVRTDVFQLGLLLYRMVASEKPFRRGQRGGVSHSIRHGRAPRLERQVPGVPQSLERIVDRCLRRRARDRYADVASVTAALIAALRVRTSTPTEVLISAALAKADLAPALATPEELSEPLPLSEQRRWRRRVALGLLAAFVLLGGAWLVSRATSDDGDAVVAGVRGIEQQPAQLRVLARPWAEVHVDGTYVDVTPIGRPIEVTPGRHSVRFKHPNAPDQVRTVEVIAGQTMWLDVTMVVTRPARGAGGASSDGGVDASP
ncbi:MAG: serine/threonine protein kinase [Deltaproteobacteria bacterium]|jgi:serine/threonine-protein kinase|nr:serine/threonine protein kinase [Deltaproteobacteria bacterium]MBW2532628.1 serine/threonine protein kinase [Deltaproteobacteria bacterium]